MSEKNNHDYTDDDSGQIKGGIKIQDVLSNKRMMLVISIIVVLLISIVAFNTVKKPNRKNQETITLGDQDKIKVGVGEEEDSGLSEEEKAELERISKELEELNKNNQENAINTNENTFGNNSDYNDDSLFQNSGGFTNIENNNSSMFSDDNNYNDNSNEKKKRSLSAMSENNNNQNNTQANINNFEQVLQGTNQTPTTSQPDDQNRQEAKRNFLSTQRTESYYSDNTRVPALSRYEIKTGTLIPATLITAITSDLPGDVVAQITRDIKDYKTMKYTLIPMGTRVIGKYDSSITYGQNRVLIVWQRLVFPDGSTLLLDNMPGVDLLGNAGLTGKTNNHFWKILRSVILSAGINMAANSLESVNVNIESSSRSRVSVGAGASDVANNVKSIGERLVEKDLNRQPTIQVKQGNKFNIFVNKDIILTPYKGR